MSRAGVLFLHHFGGSARTSDAVVAQLDGVETSAIDLPGFGAAAAADGPYDVIRYADVAEAAFDAMAAERIVVVGHSMGGKVALALAARRPRRLASLLLLSPSPPTPEPMSDADRATALAGWGDLDHAEATLARITARPLGPHARDLALDDMLRAAAGAWRAWLETGSREDIAAALARIVVPTMILCGSDDSVLPVAVHRRETMSRLPDAALRIVAGAGHLLPIEAPDMVAEAIMAQTAAFPAIVPSSAAS